MARTIMEQKAFERARKVATFANVNQGTVIGALMLIWNESQDQGLEVVNRKWLHKVGLFLFPRKATQETLLKEFVTHRFLQKVGDDAYRIKGNAKHNSNLVAYKKSAKNARQVKAQKKENVRFLNENGFQLEENHANLCSVSVLSKQDQDCNSTTAEVIHSDDGKALPVAGTEKKTKQDQFEKRPDVKDSARLDVNTDVSGLLQYLCANESESEKTFYKKSPEEREKYNGVDSRYNGNSLSHSEFLIILKIWDSERGLMIPALKPDNACQRLMKTRWEQNPSEEFWRGVVSKMASSHFLTGSKGFRATLEWTLRPGVLEKVLSGVYDNAPIKGQDLHPDTLAMIHRTTANEQAEAAAIAQKKLDQDRRNLEKQNKTKSGGLMKAGSLMGEVMNKIGEQARQTRG